jgi:sulfate permease, SulP family
MAGILCFGIIQGVVIGVVLSLLLLIARSSQTSVRRLGRAPESGIYHDIRNHEGLELRTGIVVVRVDGPLFFADADRFRSSVQDLGREEAPLFAVVIDAESIYLTDTDGADILVQVADELRGQDIALLLVHVHPTVLALWRRAGVVTPTGEDSVFESVDEAVAAIEAGRSVARVAPDESGARP